MFKKIISTIELSLEKLLRSLHRFPEAILLATLTVMVLIFLNHLGPLDNTATIRNNLNRLAAVLALGIPLSLGIRLLMERLPKLHPGIKTFFYLGAVTGLILYFCYGLPNFSMVPLSRYLALTLAFYLIFLFIPFFLRRDHFELYCVVILIRFLITYFYAAVLYLGICSIVFTVNMLFAISLKGVIYFDVWLIVAGIFAPAYFLAEIPLLESEFDIDRYPKVLKVLFLYIVVPMIIIYSVILYVYFMKIIITRSWPAGIVSNLVLWYGLICSGVFFCIHVLRSKTKWLQKLLATFPGFLLPLLAMMFVAIGIRIRAYGATESRYFVVIACLWLTGWMLYYLLAKKVRNIFLPVSLAFLAVFSVIGPWSAYSLSKWDQNRRFTAILMKYNMIDGEKLVKPDRPITPEEKAQIISLLSYFKYSHTLHDLKNLPENFKLSETAKVFGFQWDPDAVPDRDGKSFFHYQYQPPQNSQLTNIRGFDYYIDIPQTNITKTDPGEKILIAYSLETQELTLTVQNRELYRRKVSDIASRFFKKGNPPEEKLLTVLDENARVRVFYVIESLTGQGNPATEEIKINYLNFKVFIKIK